MTFKSTSTELFRALDAVGGAVPSKPTVPILECVLLERDGDELILTSTDMDLSIQHRVKVDFQGEPAEATDRVAVPFRPFVDTCRALSDLPIKFTVDENFNVDLSTDQGKYDWLAFNGQDYPDLPKAAGAQTLTFEREHLRRAVAKTSFAVSKDPVRPAMTGTFFDLTQQQGCIVSTDGHRLVRFNSEHLKCDTDVSFIVPLKALAITNRVPGNETCTMLIDERHVCFQFGSTHVFSRLIDAKFPKYQAVIPVDNDQVVNVHCTSLVKAVHRVGLFSSSTSRQVTLKISKDRLEVRAEDIERSSEAFETVECEFTGESLLIGFNSVYLEDVLKNLESEYITMAFGNPNRAGVVTPAENKPGEDVLMLIMPVMLNAYS